MSPILPTLGDGNRLVDGHGEGACALLALLPRKAHGLLGFLLGLACLPAFLLRRRFRLKLSLLARLVLLLGLNTLLFLLRLLGLLFVRLSFLLGSLDRLLTQNGLGLLLLRLLLHSLLLRDTLLLLLPCDSRDTLLGSLACHNLLAFLLGLALACLRLGQLLCLF